MTSDHWDTRRRGPSRVLRHCCEFTYTARRGVDGKFERVYHYSTPFNHPDYVAWTGKTEAEGRHLSKVRYRGWEASQEEIIGLVLTYQLLFTPGGRPGGPIDRQASRQLARRLPRRAGYLLVRPAGGFNARGAAEGLPALEWLFDRVFHRITGERYASRSSFEQVMDLAGVWRAIQDQVDVNGAIGATLGATILSAFGVLGGGTLGRAVGVWAAREAFDVWDDNQRAGFALSYLLMQLEPQARFDLMLKAQTGARSIELLASNAAGRPIRLSFGNHALAFPPFLCLAGILIHHADNVWLTPTGGIRAGVLAGGWNGPEGWKWIDNDKKFPLPGSHPYALLYRLVKLEQETRPVPFIGSVLVWVPVKSWTLLGAPLEFGWSGDTVRLQFRRTTLTRQPGRNVSLRRPRGLYAALGALAAREPRRGQRPWTTNAISST